MQNAKIQPEATKIVLKPHKIHKYSVYITKKMLTPGIQTPIIQVTKGKGVLCDETPDQRYERL